MYFLPHVLPTTTGGIRPVILILPHHRVVSDEHSAPETTAPASAPSVFMEELLGVIQSVVQADVANAIGRIDTQHSQSSVDPEVPATSAGTCNICMYMFDVWCSGLATWGCCGSPQAPPLPMSWPAASGSGLKA